jgi:hypothetical protein
MTLDRPEAALAADSEARRLFEAGKRLYLSPGASYDGSMAAAYFERAALMGLAPAQRVLGIMMLEGDQVDKDLAKAAKWLSMAAEQGDPQACFRLALMSAQGDGVAKDWSKAYELLSRPAVSALPEAGELKRRLRNGLVALYPEMRKAVNSREGLYRASLDRQQSRRIPPFLDPSSEGGEMAEFEAWLDLNLGRLSADKALEKILALMDAYYRSRVAPSKISELPSACP